MASPFLPLPNPSPLHRKALPHRTSPPHLRPFLASSFCSASTPSSVHEGGIDGVVNSMSRRSAMAKRACSRWELLDRLRAIQDAEAEEDEGGGFPMQGREEMRPSLCACCLAVLLKVLKFLQAVVGVAIVVYLVWMLNQWSRHDSGLRGVAGVAFGALPNPWFVYLFMGVGVLVCLITFTGHVAAETVNSCCLCFLSGILTGEYDAETLIMIDYMFRTIKPKLLKKLDRLIMRKIRRCFSFRFNARSAIEFCKHPLPRDADLRIRAVYSLFHSVKSDILEVFDDFILSEIGEFLAADLPADDDIEHPIGQVSVEEDDGGLTGENEVDGAVDAMHLDGEFLEINDLASPLPERGDD